MHTDGRLPEEGVYHATYLLLQGENHFSTIISKAIYTLM